MATRAPLTRLFVSNLKTTEGSPIWAQVLLRCLYVCLGVYTLALWLYRQGWYQMARLTTYHHRSPQLIREHVLKLEKIPQHIAVILRSNCAGGKGGSELIGSQVPRLLYETGELCSWCIGVGTTHLTVFEKTGLLQSISLDEVAFAIDERLSVYFGHGNSPSFKLTSTATKEAIHRNVATGCYPILTINLISETDGRPKIVELATDYATRVAAGQTIDKLTIKTVDEELKKRIGSEPDLLVSFSPNLELDGFSPWHLRITELFNLPDNEDGVNYYVFYRAIQKFSTVRIKLGT